MFGWYVLCNLLHCLCLQVRVTVVTEEEVTAANQKNDLKEVIVL
jgi:hypothetical protein